MLNNFNKLRKYCENENFQGWDPYDGLNSTLFQKIVPNSRLTRLIWIQLFKRNPINLRKICGVKKQYNPKGIALFISSYCNLYKLNQEDELLNKINSLCSLLLDMSVKGYSGACWGYNFDWQSRAFFLPKYTPNIVTTSFAVNALLDAYEVTKNNQYLKASISSADFVTKDINRFSKEEGFIFSYSPLDNTRVYNASLLGSRLLSRVYHHNKNKYLLDMAKESVLACSNEQMSDGSWRYGELDIQNWVDSFHTGYNLECLYEYQKYSNDYSFEEVINKGLSYYKNNFIRIDGAPKYYSDNIYPIDMHCPAQFIVTMSKTNHFKKNKNQIDKMLNWVFDNMFDHKNGYFYFQKKKYHTNKIPYIRWTQAWMFYSLTHYLINAND
ncbi:delta-aminolevulinic acid dehydratase [Gammaproteobacteria bacterium]|nr:delta-aminolevulinic acid dehydratase [Gammaproteobacteria bacterium]